MNFLQKITDVWQRVSLVQRALLIAIVLTCIIAAVFLTQWAGRPDMRLLYQGLEAGEASKMTEKINEKDIPYQLRDGGTAVYVPKQHVYQLRLDMAKEGLPTGGQSGYSIFDNEKVGISPKVQDINLLRALQDELAKSIQMIDGVTFARVHIVNSKQSLFASQKTETTASIMLRLQAGYRLNASNIAAITHLVAGAVDSLESQHVTVIDSQGRLLSREQDEFADNGAGTVQDYRERVEKNLEGKVVDMLSTVLGPGRATVKISAVIDMISGNTVTETYDPSTKVLTKEETTSGSETQGGTVSTEGEPIVTGGVKKDETIVTEYTIGKTIEQKVQLAGRIQSLSVAAVVDLAVNDANETQAQGGGAKIMELSAVEKLIENALGLELTPSGTSTIPKDSLTVVEAKFPRQPELLIDEDAGGGLDFVAIAGQASLGIMAICALLVLKIFSGVARKQSSVGFGQTTQLSEAEGGTIGLLSAGTGRSSPSMLRNQIAVALEKNPTEVKQLFSSWIEDEGQK